MIHTEIPLPDDAQTRLFRLIELARLARSAETSAELQFMLVNETHQLAPYLLAVFWVGDEGIVSQSGVTKVERNAPFVQWFNQVCSQLVLNSEACRVTPDLLSEDDVVEWRESLPASAVWLPIATDTTSKAGLFLARQIPWEDHEIALLVEWSDIWRHSWIKLHAPSVHGELSKGLKYFQGLLPNKIDFRSEVISLKSGAFYFFKELVTDPQWWTKLAKAIKQSVANSFNEALALYKEQGFSGFINLLVNEAKAIWSNKTRRIKWLVLVVMLFPVRISILAPSELVPANPAIIRVPIEGVVDQFFVSPNEHVVEGQQLFKLDLTTLSSRFNVAQQETQVAATEYRQSALQSLTDAKSRSQLVPQEGKAAERKVEADYLRDLIAKAQIKAPRSGIVLFDDPSEWIGKPVAAGEKVMVVAGEGDVEIEAWVPVSDAIQLPKHAPVTLYLNATPLSPVDGHLRFIGHEALQRPDGSYAYRLRASIDPDESPPHVGLKGTAKISGHFVPLVYWVMRKPLGTLRQFFGI